MMRRRILPLATCDSFSAMASRCQFGLKRSPGRTAGKANSPNALKFCASRAWKTTRSALDLHHLPFERIEEQSTADHLKNVKDLPATQQNDTSGSNLRRRRGAAL